MSREEVQEVVEAIMILDGPDGHCDGSDIITDFVMALTSGCGKSWFETYKQKHIDRLARLK